MNDFLFRNRFIILLFGLWFLVGSYSPMGFMPLGIASVMLMWRRQLFLEIILGYFFILILSDNLKTSTDFAKIFKNIYTVLLVFIAILERKRITSSSSIFKPMIPFLIVALIALPYSPTIALSAQKTLSYFIIFFAIPQLIILAFQQRKSLVFKDLIFTGIAMILVGFVLWFIDPNIPFSHGGRFRAVFGNPNGLGIFATLLYGLIVLTRSYFPALLQKNDLRWIFIPLIIAVLLSGSRTAIISVSLLYIFAHSFRVSPIIGVVLFIGIAVGAEIISTNLVSIVENTGFSEYLRAETLDDGSGRYIAWQFAWNAIQEHYWLGRGFSFDEWLMDTNQGFLNDLGHQGGVHNTYLIIWLNTGIIGLVLFLRGLVLNFIRGSKHNRLAFPLFWMVLFGITLEPWLAASLNPYTILFVISLSLLNESVFQTQTEIESETNALPLHAKVLA